MELISFDYSKQRSEFGHHPNFEDFTPEATSIDNDASLGDQWMTRVTTTVELDCIPGMSQHEVNTEQFVQTPKGTSHTEGAWPSDVKTNDWTDRQRLLRRIKNEAGYQSSVVSLIKTAESAIQQNNTIDLFEDYFDEVEVEAFANEPPSAKTVAVFRDPNDVKRAATKISWHPDNANKLAVSYSILQFQQMPKNMPLCSYIWDLQNPNQPDRKIIPQSPLSCLEFNPRSPDQLVGGSYNGLVAFWDLRKDSHPTATSLIENSHHDPVYDVFWVQSRSGNECCSVSTDGQLLWWDIRNLKGGPLDRMVLSNNNKDKAPGSDIIYGGTAMEYKNDAGATRYLVGTEQGCVLLCDRKAKKDSESQKSIKSIYGLENGRHHGPIYSIERNPNNLKYFLTVGDWTARIWMEDLKAPIMTTKYDGSYLTAGCWSPTRHGVFYTTKMDGTLDVWDFFHKQNDPTFSTKVGDGGLSSIKVQSNGKLVALGSLDGTTTVLEVSGAISSLQKNEKQSMVQMFERETKRERNLEMRSHQKKTKANKKTESKKSSDYMDAMEEYDDDTKSMLDNVEKQFYEMIDISSNNMHDDYGAGHDEMKERDYDDDHDE